MWRCWRSREAGYIRVDRNAVQESLRVRETRNNGEGAELEKAREDMKETRKQVKQTVRRLERA